MNPITTYLLLGGNLGDRQANLEKAVMLLAEKIGTITQKSAVYESQAWGTESGPDYLNQAVEIQTILPPVKLLPQLLAIETSLGRVRDEQHRYAPRTIDIDIIFYDKLILRTDTLQIPHPQLTTRMFTLLPLSEIAGDFKHPVNGKTINELKSECADTLKVEKFKN